MQAPFFLLVYGFWGVQIAAHHEFLFFALFSFLWRFRHLRTLSSPKAPWARWCTCKKSRFCSAKPDNSSGELEMFTCMFWKILIVTKWSWAAIKSSTTTLDKKKNHHRNRGEKNAVPRVISCSIRRDQRRASPIRDCPRLLPCADRAWSSMISHVEQRSSRRDLDDGSFFLSRVVWPWWGLNDQIAGWQKYFFWPPPLFF